MRSWTESDPSNRATAETVIVLLVMDGLGGLPWSRAGDGARSRQYAKSRRAGQPGHRGLHVPVGPGITPGRVPTSGVVRVRSPQYQVGRGAVRIGGRL